MSTTLEILNQYNLRATRQRRDILSVLKKHSILSAKQIHHRLKGKLDLASVYRNLKEFSYKNIVYQENIQGIVYYYFSQKPHHHIICTKCGRIECIPCQHFFKNIKNFKHINHQLLLNGICNKCY